jgi:hypothetical protein
MMKSPKFSTLIIFLAFGCENEHATTPLIPIRDHIIFGTFYGMCAGEQCVELFALQNEKLYEDRSDLYPQSPPAATRDFEELSADQYDLVIELYHAIPEELLETESTIFGCPDCSDGGGIYLEIKTDQFTKVFFIDNFKHNLPQYLHPLVDDIHERVALLQ